MSMWGEVFESLQTMSVWQLLFAFVACTGYALAQGRLVGTRAKWTALGLAGLAVVGFVIEAERWVDGFMLVAVAVAGMGVFAALVWAVSRALGMTSGALPRSAEALSSQPPHDADGASDPASPITGRRRAATSP